VWIGQLSGAGDLVGWFGHTVRQPMSPHFRNLFRQGGNAFATNLFSVTFLLVTGLIAPLDCIRIHVISLLLLSSHSLILTRDVFPSRRFFVRRRGLSSDGSLLTDDSMM